MTKKNPRLTDTFEAALSKAKQSDNSYIKVEEENFQSVKSEQYDIKIYPENNDLEEEVLLNDIFGVKKKDLDQEGITMKGKSIEFKNACIAVKSKLTKGKILKDDKGRQITILNEKADGALDVEVNTLSKKVNEKRGQAMLHMYKPNRARNKNCSILVSRSKGHDIVFSKVLMEKFIKPMIDSVLSDADANPLKSFSGKPQDKTVGKENVTVKQDTKDNVVQCDKCDKVFVNQKGLRIHKGKVHTVKLDPNLKRKRSELCENEEVLSVNFVIIKVEML